MKGELDEFLKVDTALQKYGLSALKSTLQRGQCHRRVSILSPGCGSCDNIAGGGGQKRRRRVGGSAGVSRHGATCGGQQQLQRGHQRCLRLRTELLRDGGEIHSQSGSAQHRGGRQLRAAVDAGRNGASQQRDQLRALRRERSCCAGRRVAGATSRDGVQQRRRGCKHRAQDGERAQWRGGESSHVERRLDRTHRDCCAHAGSRSRVGPAGAAPEERAQCCGECRWRRCRGSQWGWERRWERGQQWRWRPW